MTRKVIWNAEERQVPALRRVVTDGIVKRGADISSAPPAILDQMIAQGLAKEELQNKRDDGAIKKSPPDL